MRLLVLGGTQFLGRHLVQAARDAGDVVTIFHRGRTNPDLFAGQVERIAGDRDGGLDALAGGEWDAVVDTCGYVPRVVGASARALAERCGHYTFVSSESVYGDVGRAFAEHGDWIAAETLAVALEPGAELAVSRA